jgi:hypothetical protein
MAMEVRLFPNSTRPGVGLKPRCESQRPLLPQHARHCPVLEAGSAIGFLVYPPLDENEAFQMRYQGEGRYRFVYYVNPTGRKWEAVFAVAITFPVGGIGMFTQEVRFMTRVPTTSQENALLMARTFFVPEDLGTPPGALSLRGAWNFRTPPGWDTLYTPIFNMIERPVAPMLVVRVETDWYAHETEFRYVLQAGEGISGERNMPIGQVLFVPREEFTLGSCTEDELAAIRQSTEEFSREKAAQKLTTPYGLMYSPHYLRKSRSQNSSVRPVAHGAMRTHEPDPGVVPAEPPRPLIVQRSETDVVPTTREPALRRVGRNDPCPCGSGRKYKKCHGEDS